MHREQQPNSNFRPAIAVVSPFLDKRHGTERCVAEQIERLATEFEIHLYSTAVQDVDLARITWHRVPRLPGPHLFGYCWWFVANFLCRQWHRLTEGFEPALVYSPGVNCWDADLSSVHVVFGAYVEEAGTQLEFRSHPASFWPRLLHRRLYYALMVALERLLYAPPRRDSSNLRKGFAGFKRPALTAISGKAARNLCRYGRAEADIPVIVYGIDGERFNPAVRESLRAGARHSLGLDAADFALLLVGNDWRNKGLPCLLQALSAMPESSVRLLVVGNDDIGPYRDVLARLQLEDRIQFLPMRADVEFYYAAADVYAGPSLNDAFGLPPLEAMACGLPAITTSRAGVSEVIHEGVDGFVLEDPHDSRRLAEVIALLHNDLDLRRTIGENAAVTARNYTWERNAQQLGRLFRQLLKSKHAVEPAAQLAADAVNHPCP